MPLFAQAVRVVFDQRGNRVFGMTVEQGRAEIDRADKAFRGEGDDEFNRQAQRVFDVFARKSLALKNPIQRDVKFFRRVIQFVVRFDCGGRGTNRREIGRE